MKQAKEFFANHPKAEKAFKYATGIGASALALAGVLIAGTKAVEGYEDFRQDFMSCSVVNPQNGESVMTPPVHGSGHCSPGDYSLFDVQIFEFNEPIDVLGILPRVSSEG